MMKEPDLDPPRPGDQKRTYYDRRAAMYFGGTEALREARNRAFRALARRDRQPVSWPSKTLRRDPRPFA
jgi:hypothetical protein